jgi:outer membrane protein assembly complex protein YaeT
MRFVRVFLFIAFAGPVFCAFAEENRDLERALAGADILLQTLKPAAESKVQFQGLSAFKDEELRTALGEQIREIDEKGATPARADDVAYFAGAHYRKSGFSRVESEYRIAEGKVIVTLQEGPRTLLGGLSFSGNRTFISKTLFEYMLGASAERLKAEPDLFPFNESEIAAGADRVRGFYVSEGFLDARVDASSVKMSSDGTRAEVTVRIVEGTRYVVGDIAFSGTPIFPRERLIAALREPVAGAFSATRAISMQGNLESFYRSQGYFLAKVELAAEPKKARGGKVPIRFSIKPGAVHRFDGVAVKNQTPDGGRLRESFLPRRFRHLEGEVYEPEKVDEIFRELLRSGLFTTLKVTPKPLRDETVRLDFLVEEAKAREVGFTLGFGTYDGLKIGLRLADRNLFGNGRPLTLAADYSQRGLIAELAYVDPWFFDHPRMNLRAKLYSAAREELGYTKNEIGGRLDLGWKVLPRWEAGVFAQQSQVEITDATIPLEALGPLNYTLTSVGLTQTIDFRDNPVAPTRGWVFTTAWDVATIEGEQAFTRGVARFSTYIPLGKWQLALGARVGALQPIGDSIPIETRFFNGGATTVRSFAERDLGPKDAQDNPLGGEFYTVLNAELTFPIGGGLQGAVFVDAGNLTDWDEAGLSDLRYAVGVGLRYALPVGPLRLDYGVNPDRRAGEDFGAFHLSFGMAF